MRPETIVTLSQMQAAGLFIRARAGAMTLEQYIADETVRCAVERKFEIIGEAATRLVKASPEIAATITDIRGIISFRNRIVHGYDVVSDKFVWDNMHDPLRLMLKEVGVLLAEGSPEGAGAAGGIGAGGGG